MVELLRPLKLHAERSKTANARLIGFVHYD